MNIFPPYLMPVSLCNNLSTKVAPYFADDLILFYCRSIDDKEKKGFCSNDLKEDLLRIIRINHKEPLAYEQKQAILYLEECIKTYDQKIERLWKELKEVECLPDESEVIGQDFYFWKKGTCKYDIWNWFDYQYSKGVSYLIHHV